MVGPLRRCQWGWRLSALPVPGPVLRDRAWALGRRQGRVLGKHPWHRGNIAVRVAPTGLDAWRAGSLSHHGSRRVFRAGPGTGGVSLFFTRGSVPLWDAPSERQGLMNHAAHNLSCPGPSPAVTGGFAAACTLRHRALSRGDGHHHVPPPQAPRRLTDKPHPEPSGGPLPASLACRWPHAIPFGSVARRKTAHRSSHWNDEAYADRRHARGRNPRRGAGR